MSVKSACKSVCEKCVSVRVLSALRPIDLMAIGVTAYRRRVEGVTTIGVTSIGVSTLSH